MVRGTTPTHIFNCDVDLSAAEVLFITYRQNGQNVLEKSLEDVTINGEEVEVRLTQADTLAFSDLSRVRIQIRVGFPDGTRIASNIIDTSVLEILKEGEI